VSDLRSIAQEHHFFYLSVDVLSPKGVRKMAKAIVDEGIDIKWAAEFRLEKTYKPDFCELLRKSGCVAGSMGLESANQRIIDLIDKGTDAKTLPATIHNFTASGIGVQLMGFTGFPTETSKEALDTLEFLDTHQEDWALAGVGEFHLTAQAIVAKEPERFGVTLIRRRDVDVEVCPPYTTETGELDSEATEQLAKRKSEVGGQGMQDGLLPYRPFLGGIDTPHTLLYFERFGPEFFRHFRMLSAAMQVEAESLPTDWVPTPAAIEVNESAFDLTVSAQTRHALETTLLEQYKAGGSATTAWISERLAEQGAFHRLDNAQTFYVLPKGGRNGTIRTSFALRSLLRSMNGKRSLEEVLSLYGSAQRQVGLRLVKQLIARGFVTMIPPQQTTHYPGTDKLSSTL